MRTISRRSVLQVLAGATVAAGAPPFVRRASAAKATPVIGGELRGAIDASQHGVTPGGGARQGRKLAELISQAARQDLPVLLPPGNYPVSDLQLPDGARITGVAGASRLVQAGGGPVLRADGAGRVELSNLVIDGTAGEESPALLHLRGVGSLTLDNCEIHGGRRNALNLERCGGRIERSRISGAGDYGILAVDSSGLSVTGNVLEDCGNGGILIHRSAKGSDGTIVSGNRITRTGASLGGTGQYGNAINLFRADNVIVSGNHISDSAFSAVRANSASNAQIVNNQCLRSGETAIYAEFAFEGAIISGNIIDGAANGISVVNFNEGGRLATVVNNIVRNLRLVGPYVLDEAIFGVGISVEADTVVSGNAVEDAPLWGLAVGSGPYLRNVSVTGNVVRQAGTGCAVTVVEGAGNALIANNLFQSVERGAIIGYRWKAPATRDLIASPVESFAHLAIENNRAG
ncbi:TIGR03808 family TAT-translocated repetitive protein [Neorhizobium sp. SOG26]|uniref:TIGR03808 family TAT-translocated repetitive protein n=1 Tax=Neorhizobium sp. SOG26 TaxID=2060726 RepID=UPI000E58E2A5|nr:TIGR03808 family TAT-translocated repetitive protein [Neorhizobium sp. SOG26]AXV14687.1 TIGR03808 family TAT-translocated repetitive protein [Neorhizobium sp. SOG26]